MPEESDSWLPLFMLASHAAGDFPLQTDQMATRKFDSCLVRAAHVAVYTLAFIPTVLASEWSRRRSLCFLALLALSHYVIDSRRWATPRDGFETRPVWFDQAHHLIALALCIAVVERVPQADDRMEESTRW